MGNGGYLLRDYLPGDEVPITDMFNRVFGPGDPEFVPRGVDWWRWKFPGNPAGSHTMVAEDPDGAVIAHYGGVPLAVRAEGETVLFGQNCDCYSDPAARRGLKNPGTFVRLAQAYASTFARPGVDAVMYGMATPAHYRLGVRYLDYWMLRTQLLLVCRDASRLPDWDWSTHAVETASFDARADAFSTALEARHRCFGRRDAAFLNWRFRDHPRRPYRAAFAKTGDRDDYRGHVVYASARMANRHMGLVVDWAVAPDDDGAARSLLRWAGERAGQAGHRELGFLCPTSSAWFRRFQEFGFEVEPSPYVMIAREYDARFEAAYLRDHWWYTLADFDVV
jgi:hypothetical protein